MVVSGTSFSFGRFAHDSQGILAAIQRLAFVGIERGLNLGVCAVELRATAFADGKARAALYDSEFALRHEDSLPPKGCANETAPVPESWDGDKIWLSREVREAGDPSLRLRDGSPRDDRAQKHHYRDL
jgi:hypothetical protein